MKRLLFTLLIAASTSPLLAADRASRDAAYWQQVQANQARNAAAAARYQTHQQRWSTPYAPSTSYYQRAANGQGGWLYTPGRTYQVVPSANRTGYWIFGR